MERDLGQNYFNEIFCRKQEALIDEKDEQLEKEREKLESLKGTHNDLKSDHSQYLSKYEDLKKDKENAVKKLEAQREEIADLKKDKENALKKLESQKQEIEELNSELQAQIKKLEEEKKLKKDVESDMKNKKMEEHADDARALLVKANESHAADSKNNAEVDGESSFKKQDEKVGNAVDEKSVIEKPHQEFKFERHNIDDEVEKVAKDDDDMNLDNSLV